MQKIIVSLFAFLFTTGFACSSWAADTQHPCKQVKEACEAAGYKQKGGKGKIRDCMGPLLAGQDVPGVSVDANTIAACKSKGSKMKQQRMMRQTTQSTTSPTSSTTSTTGTSSTDY